MYGVSRDPGDEKETHCYAPTTGWQHNEMMVTVSPSIPCMIESPQWKDVARDGQITDHKVI